MRDFFLNWKEADDKEERMYCLEDSQDSIISFVMFGSKKNKHYDENKSRLYKVMSDEKFYKTCKKMLKKSTPCDLNPAFAAVVLSFLEEGSKELDEELVNDYMTLAKKCLKKRMEALQKKVDLPESLVFVTLGSMPDTDLVNNNKIMGKFISKALNRLYSYSANMSKEDVEKISTQELKVLMKKVFGKDSFPRVLVTLALESGNVDKFNDNSKLLYSKFTELLLDELSDCSKKDLVDFFDVYIGQRKRAYNDYKRRVDFTLLEGDKYDKVKSALEQLDDEDLEYVK